MEWKKYFDRYWYYSGSYFIFFSVFSIDLIDASFKEFLKLVVFALRFSFPLIVIFLVWNVSIFFTINCFAWNNFFLGLQLVCQRIIWRNSKTLSLWMKLANYALGVSSSLNKNCYCYSSSSVDFVVYRLPLLLGESHLSFRTFLNSFYHRP